MQYRLGLLALAIAVGFVSRGEAQERFDGYYAGLSLNAARATAEAGGLDAEQRSSTLGIYGGLTRVQPGGFAWGAELGLTGFSGEGTLRDGRERGDHESGGILSAKGRLGYATEQLFVFGTLGLSATNGGLMDDKDDTNITISPMIGLGAEFAVTEDWSVRLDATRHNFSGPRYDFGAGKERVDAHVDVISFGISRKF
ncbi:outer membrane protein [Primorskyibacter sp. S187A]|uniref:outer membrane protein n=1 Tax=Primorskyibacter sp. S187A TaxID=3415130 RepID=UPI003C7C2D27